MSDAGRPEGCLVSLLVPGGIDGGDFRVHGSLEAETPPNPPLEQGGNRTGEGTRVDNRQSEFLCVRCARHMKTCCQTSQVYVTPGDVERIAARTGVESFHEYQPPDDPIYLQHDDDPAWMRYVYRPDGTRRILKRRPNGDCVFLGANGCSLPGDVRPLLCRIYPYDFNEQGIYPTLARGCPLELLPDGQTLLEALDMRRDDAERLHRQLYEEIRLEETYVPLATGCS